MSDHEALTVPCDRCGALAGEYCRTTGSGIRMLPHHSHDARWEKLHPGVPLATAVWPSMDKAHYIWVRRGKTPRVLIRLGRTRPLFSERHQGTRGIPVTWHYFFSRRLSIRLVLKADR